MKPSDYIKKGWCQGTAARDKDGHEVEADNPNAVCWCIIGSCMVAYPKDGNKRSEIYHKLDIKLFRPIVAWHDNRFRTQKDVIKILESIGE